MGQFMSGLKISYEQNPVNYFCPVCKNTGQTPNIAGKFFYINETECKCNGCNTVFEKKTLNTLPQSDEV
jgi:hypothetical protein